MVKRLVFTDISIQEKELIDFLENHDLFKFKLDGGSEQMVKDALHEFFDRNKHDCPKMED